MKTFTALTASIAALVVAPIAHVAALHAQEQGAAAPSPNEIVAQAAPNEWMRIAAEDLLVMTLAPDAEGNAREVVIQLMPAPFSQGWVENIRLLARAGWYDNISINRVQDNYVVQWGDPNYDNPEATGEARPLPEGLKVMEEGEYTTSNLDLTQAWMATQTDEELEELFNEPSASPAGIARASIDKSLKNDAYSYRALYGLGWSLAQEGGKLNSVIWPVHCYGMVGVGRNLSPDTGSGAELYTVIGHAPRHLDRNIALVGRVIEGMEHLSSLPRGKGDLGFYADFEKDKRTPILSVRVASDLRAHEQPAFEYLSTESESFGKYAEARANRRDPFFIVPAGGADICNIPVPVRRVVAE